ncbi:PEP-CTERM sorting domain-containing protein, partial [Oleiphilus sp. HI0067]
VGDGDGIGIKKHGDRDEINNPQGGDKIEKLTVTFDASVVIDEILVLDLFNNEYLGYRLKPGPYADSPFIPAGPGSAGGAGFLSILTGFDSTDRTSWIQFTVPQGAGDDSDQDFALAGLRVTAVPEPRTLALLGLGLLGLARIRKRV